MIQKQVQNKITDKRGLCRCSISTQSVSLKQLCSHTNETVVCTES